MAAVTQTVRTEARERPHTYYDPHRGWSIPLCRACAEGAGLLHLNHHASEAAACGNPLCKTMSPVEPVMDDPDAPDHSACPKCGAWVPDYDGFGVLAHLGPTGCGYCSHPSRDDGKCGICGEVRP